MKKNIPALNTILFFLTAVLLVFRVNNSNAFSRIMLLISSSALLISVVRHLFYLKGEGKNEND